MDKERVINGIIKAVSDAVDHVHTLTGIRYGLTTSVNTTATSVVITFNDGQRGKNSMQFNVEPDGLLVLHNIHLPPLLIHKGLMTSALSEIRKLPGLNGWCRVALALNREGWKKILTNAGFIMM